MPTHTWCFCSQIRKLQAFEISKWAALSEWKSQRWSKKRYSENIGWYQSLVISYHFTSEWYHFYLFLICIYFTSKYKLMIVNTLKMCTGDAGPEQSLVLFIINFVVFWFLKKNCFQKIISQIPSEHPTVLDPDQVGHYVQPDLGPNCLQRLSADITSNSNFNTCPTAVVLCCKRIYKIPNYSVVGFQFLYHPYQL